MLTVSQSPPEVKKKKLVIGDYKKLYGSSCITYVQIPWADCSPTRLLLSPHILIPIYINANKLMSSPGTVWWHVEHICCQELLSLSIWFYLLCDSLFRTWLDYISQWPEVFVFCLSVIWSWKVLFIYLYFLFPFPYFWTVGGHFETLASWFYLWWSLVIKLPVAPGPGKNHLVCLATQWCVLKNQEVTYYTTNLHS